MVRKVCAIKGLADEAQRTVNCYVVFADAAGAARAAAEANGAAWPQDGETFHLRVDRASGSRGAADHLHGRRSQGQPHHLGWHGG